MAAALLVAGWVLPRLGQFLAVDRCLDAGGVYNDQTKVCEGARPGG